MTPPFDRALARRRRERAARLPPTPRVADVLRYVADEIPDRLRIPLAESPREPRILLVGTLPDATRILARMSASESPPSVLADSSSVRARRDRGERRSVPLVVLDEESPPFADGVFDAAIFALTLHWSNEPRRVLERARKTLRDGGVVLAALPVGDSLAALRSALLAAEIEIRGGASRRFVPLPDVRDLGAIAASAGFADVVADVDRLPLVDVSAREILRDLASAGERSAARSRSRVALRRDAIRRAEEIFRLGGGRDVLEIGWLTGRVG